MTNKRVYYEIIASGSLNGIYDHWEHNNVPLDLSNSDYQHFLLLSASNRAILVPDSGSIPGDVTDSLEIYSAMSLPVTSSYS